MINGNDNVLLRNSAEDNGAHGIHVGTGLGLNNTISKNTATGHVAPSFDLTDDHAGCDGNVWSQNTFATKSQACIQ